MSENDATQLSEDSWQTEPNVTINPADIPLMLHGEDPEDHAADAQPANIPPARPPTPQPQVAPLVAQTESYSNN